MIGFDKIQWAQHWTNGGTGVTILSNHRLPIYQRAIAEYGSPDVWIETEPELSLHTLEKDLSRFWVIFDRIQKEMSAQPENAA